MLAAAVASKYRSVPPGSGGSNAAAGNRRSAPAYAASGARVPAAHAALIREQPDRTRPTYRSPWVRRQSGDDLAGVKQLGFTVKKNGTPSETSPRRRGRPEQWATTPRRSTRLASNFWMAGSHQSPAALSQPSRPAGRRSRAPGSVGEQYLHAALRVRGSPSRGFDGPMDGASFLAYVEQILDRRCSPVTW